MGKILKRNQPCLRCSSSDAMQIYEDGGAKCFSCGDAFNFQREWAKKHGDAPPTYEEDNYRRNHYRKEIDLADIEALPSRGYRSRVIPKTVMEFFDVKVSYDEDGNIDRYYYPIENEVGGGYTGYKTKDPNNKKATYSVGKVSNVFGLNKFQNGGMRIVITEGEEDALAVASSSMLKYGKIYPVISMGGTQQVDFLLKNREILRKFDEVILWFDNDQQGQDAIPKASRIIGADKVKVIKSQLKDACDEWVAVGGKSFKEIWSYIYDAAPYSPAGIVQGENTWERYQQYKNLVFVPWPPFLSRLNELTHGRALGTITMIAAGTGVGKSTVLREDIYHLLMTTNEKLGACFLEENVGETTGGIMGLHLNKRLGLPDVELEEGEERRAWEETIGLPGRIEFVDHQGSISDGSLIDKLEYMALSGCKYIYLDHVTLAVSEVEGDNINSAIDKFMSDLLKLVERHMIWVGVVSHLRKVRAGEDAFEKGGPISEDDLKGSGSLKQISFQTIAISRNKMEEDISKRNRSQIFLLKDRKTGNTGPAGAYRFDPKTGRLHEVEVKDEDEFELIKEQATL